MQPTAIILAAGRADRLAPLARHRPKALFNLAGRPVIDHLVEALKANGVRDLVVVLGEHGERIQSFLSDGSDRDLRITYVHQAKGQGPAAAVSAGLDGVAGPFLVAPSNALVTADTLRPLFRVGPDALLLAPAEVERDHWVPVQRAGRLERMDLAPAIPGKTLVSTGFLCGGPALADRFRGAEGAIEPLLADHDVQVVEAGGLWHPLVEPQDLLRIHDHAFAEGSTVHETATVDPSAVLVAPVAIGPGAIIGERAVVGPHVAVRTNSRIGALCEVRDSIINSNVTVDARCVVRHAILDDGVQIGAGALLPDGCTAGEDAVVPVGSVVPAGTVLDVGQTFRRS